MQSITVSSNYATLTPACGIQKRHVATLKWHQTDNCLSVYSLPWCRWTGISKSILPVYISNPKGVSNCGRKSQLKKSRKGSSINNVRTEGEVCMAQCGQKQTRGRGSIFTVFLQTFCMDDPKESVYECVDVTKSSAMCQWVNLSINADVVQSWPILLTAVNWHQRDVTVLPPSV